jgi:SRSO17 transposase
MNRTFTPPLGPAVLERLEAYADRFRPHFNHPRQALWSGVYLRGLIQEGERKSIEPLSRRVSLPAELASAWPTPSRPSNRSSTRAALDETAVAREYRATMAEASADSDGVFLVDDTTFPKAGQHSGGASASTAGPWARKLTASAPCRCIMWPRGATVPCRCGSICHPSG